MCKVFYSIRNKITKNKLGINFGKRSIRENRCSINIDNDEDDTGLSRVDELGLYKGNNTAIELDTSFELSAASTENIEDIEELVIVVRYSF